MSASLRLGLFLSFTLLLCCQVSIAAQSNGCDGAGNCYVRAGAGGSGKGADWTNAYTDLPSSLVRGVTYYVAAGSYGAHTYQDADSGATLITIQAATAAVHGTATGWSNSYVGQATFQAGQMFYTDYYTFNGVYRANNRTPWVDWNNASGYGFAVNNAAGGGTRYFFTAVSFGNADQDSGIAVHNITFEYVDINGSHSTNSDVTDDWGIWSSGVISGTQNSNIYVGYVHVHNTGGNELNVDGNNGFIGEYSWFELMNQTNTAGKSHSEPIDFRGNGTNPTSNAIFRYNFVEGGGGTAFFATTNGAGAATNWYIYGNFFFDNPSEELSPAPTSGNGILTTGYGYTSLTNLYFVNNTISSINSGGACGVSPDTTATYTNYVVENNLWYNCAQYGGPVSNATTWNYNEYYDSSKHCSNDTSSNVVCSASDPFVNVADSAGADNFNLTGHTTAGVALSSSLPTGCSGNCLGTDMAGNTGTDRGALQYGTAITPPTKLQAVVH